ncbi:MAG: NAD(P)-binding domain-containing protein, partial [Billgrantia desiderata]
MIALTYRIRPALKRHRKLRSPSGWSGQNASANRHIGKQGRAAVSDGTTPRVGVIGLGAMGLGTATALHERGLTVVGCDVAESACRAFEATGGRCAATPAELAAQCDVVLVVVVNAAQVEQV